MCQINGNSSDGVGILSYFGAEHIFYGLLSMMIGTTVQFDLVTYAAPVNNAGFTTKPQLLIVSVLYMIALC